MQLSRLHGQRAAEPSRQHEADSRVGISHLSDLNGSRDGLEPLNQVAAASKSHGAQLGCCSEQGRLS